MRDAPRDWPWHALAFAVYPLLYLAVTNPGKADPAWVARSCVVASGAEAGLIAAKRMSMPLPAAGASAAWIILIFFSYGPVNVWWIELLFTGIEHGVTGIGWFAASAQLLHSLVWLLLAWGGLALLRRHAARTEPFFSMRRGHSRFSSRREKGLPTLSLHFIASVGAGRAVR